MQILWRSEEDAALSGYLSAETNWASDWRSLPLMTWRIQLTVFWQYATFWYTETLYVLHTLMTNAVKIILKNSLILYD
jgi:hypothetical protein